MVKKALNLIRPDAAGIDIASGVHYVAVPEGCCEQSVRSFGTFTDDLHTIAKWLVECKVGTVAMESTGVYWIQLFLILEEYGLEVFLVNARHIKNVSGRKSDTLDCQWIQQLHSYGLLTASFQPDSITRELRTYLRQRKSLTESYSKEILHIQKAFDQMNIKLHNVLSDICGKTGQRMIQAILSGEQNPEKLVEYCDPRVKASKDELIKSLKGVWREENLFELKQAYELYHIFKEKIKDCDEQIEKTVRKLGKNAHTKKDNNIKRKGNNKNSLSFNGTLYLKNILGIDVTKIFGISELTALEIVSETGIDMTKWKTDKHFTSWLNLAPNNRVSGGKLLKPKKSKRRNKAGQALLIAAYALQRSDHWLGQYYRRMKSRNGPLVATKATARKLAIIFYKMIKNRTEFNPIPIETYSQNYRELRLKHLKKQATNLGYQLVAMEFVS